MGPIVADFCAAAGFAPDEEQARILDNVFAERRGWPAAREGMVVAPRQNLKSAALEMVALGWMFVTCEPGMIWSAHQHSTVRGAFEHIAGLIESNAALNKYLAKDPISSPGSEHIVLRDPDGTKRYLMFATRSGRGYRGRSFGKHIHDEYLYMQSAHEGALFPTQTTFPDWQRIGATSAGLPESGRARALRDRGRPMDREKEPSFFYAECCDDLPGACALGDECSHAYGVEGCILDARARWQRANTGVVRERITLDYIAGERRSLDPDEFFRERLGRWDDPDPDSEPVFSEEALTAEGVLDPSSTIDDEPVFALQISPDQDWSALVVAGRTAEGRIHIETTSARRGDLRVYNHRRTTDWIVPWLRARLEPRGSRPARYESMRLVIVNGSQAAAHMPALSQIDGLDITVMPEAQAPLACGHLLGAVARQEIVHLGDPELMASLLSVGRRTVGEKAFVWSPRASGGDITVAQAATWAAWTVAQELK